MTRPALAVLLALASAPVFAQTSVAPMIDPSVQIGTMQNAVLIEGMRQSFDLSNQAAKRAAPSKSPARLDFQRDSKVSAEVRRGLADALDARSAGSGRILDDDALLREFDRVLAKFGYSGRNIADVMTAYLVMNWELVNQADASGSTAGIAAVRQNIAADLQRSGALAKADDATKQASSESLSYAIMLALAAQDALRRSSDQPGIAALRRTVAADVRRSTGLDLASLQLSSRGFSPR